MDVQLIEMNKEEAREAYLEYRQGRESEDEEIARIYKAIAKEQPVFDVNEVMAKAGMDHYQHPKLAICRADAEFVWLHTWSNGRVAFCMDRNWEQYWSRRYVSIPEGFFPSDIEQNTWRAKFRAIVPIIPPNLRPKFKLSNYHILWEPKWAEDPRPPYDPYLCKRLGGPVFSVLAAWDLTEVERMVIGMRV